MGHYAALSKLVRSTSGGGFAQRVLIWQKVLHGEDAPLSIVLEPARLAPMEGELQLRFSFKSDLYVLTFLLAPGQVFDLDCRNILFIGGVQGRIGAREEVREASRLNGEISPAAMLVLAVQAIGRVMRVDGLIAIGEDDHISMGYSPAKIMFDYRRLWTEVGGKRVGAHYRLPLQTVHKPLSEISLSHRRRTKRKREAKKLVSESIERALEQMMQPHPKDTPTSPGS